MTDPGKPAQPTPTQAENDRAKLGEHVMVKEYDGSGLDRGALPIGAPEPELPDRPPEPEVEPPDPPEPEVPEAEPKDIPVQTF